MTYISRNGVLLCFVAVVSGCSDSSELENQPHSAGETRVEFRRSSIGDPDSLDPHNAVSATAVTVLRDLYEGLVSESSSDGAGPGVAYRWEVSRDGTEYVFHLSPEARWSNGASVSAQDFERSFQKAVDPESGSARSDLFDPILNAESIVRGELPPSELGVSAIDSQTLKIKLRTPVPYFLALLAHPAFYPVYAGQSSTDQRVSNGPYVLEEWVIGGHIKLARNSEYWDSENVKIDTVFYYPMESETTEFNRYRTGELDYTSSIPATRIDLVLREFPDEVHLESTLNVYYYAFNLERPPFKGNKKLRKALSLVVDRELIVTAVTRAGQVPAYGYVPPGVQNYTTWEYAWKDKPMESRIRQAKQHYAEAGYSREKPLRLTLLYNTHESLRKINEAVAAMWKEYFGIQTEMINEDFATFLQTRKDKDRWQVIRLAWDSEFNDAYPFAQLFLSDFSQNDSGYSNEMYDHLVQKAEVESDQAKRRKLLEEAEAMMLEDYAIIPIYFYVTKHLIQPHVDGHRPSITNSHPSKNYRILR